MVEGTSVDIASKVAYNVAQLDTYPLFGLVGLRTRLGGGSMSMYLFPISSRLAPENHTDIPHPKESHSHSCFW